MMTDGVNDGHAHREGVHGNGGAGRLTRRTFLRTAAPAAAGIGMMAAGRRAPAAAAGRRGANDEINVGIIGCGSRGGYLSYVFQIVPGARVVALCEVHAKRLAKIDEQCGGGLATYRDYRELLDSGDIDAVVIATNEHWHVLQAIHACQAGKDIYLEKPVGQSIGEGRALIDVARETGRIIQMGTQQRSWDHYRRAVELIRAGRLGEIAEVEVWDYDNFSPGFGAPPDEPPPPELDWDLWLGPAREAPYNRNRYDRYYWFRDYGGGWQVVWGVHHYDIVHWAMDVRAPVAAVGLGGRFAFTKDQDNRELPDTFTGLCEYPAGPVAKNGFLLRYMCSTSSQNPLGRRLHAKAFHGTRGTLVIDRSGYEIRADVRDGEKLVAEEAVTSEKREHEVMQDHVRGFVEAVRERRTPESNLEVGHHASNPGHLMNIAWRVGRRIRWDAEHERVIDDPEADAMLTAPYRAPWKLPGPARR